MSAREFNEWIAFYELYPFGELRADMRAGQVASPIVNALRALGGSSHRTRPLDWVHDLQPTQPNWRQMRDTCKAIAEVDALIAKRDADQARRKKQKAR